MSVLLDLPKGLNEYQAILDNLAQNLVPMSVYGLSPIHKAHMTSMFLGDLSCPILYIAPDEERAKRICGDIKVFYGVEPIFLPYRDFIFHKMENFSREYEQQRIGALYKIAVSERPVVVTTADALLTRCIPKSHILNSGFTISYDKEYSQKKLISKLVSLGYKRFAAVEGQGQFALRGDILDIFIPLEQNPVRCEFFGDTVDSLSYFDVATQRRMDTTQQITLLPVTEAVYDHKALIDQLERFCSSCPNVDLVRSIKVDIEQLEQGIHISAIDRYMPLLYKMETPVNYMPQDTMVVVDESLTVLEHSQALEYRINESVTDLLAQGTLLPGNCDFTMSHSGLQTYIAGQKSVIMDAFLASSGFKPRAIISVSGKQLPAYGGSFDAAATDIESYTARGYYTFVLTGGEKRSENMARILEERGIRCQHDASQARPGIVYVLPFSVSAGFEYPGVKLAVISEGQIVAGSRGSKSAQKSGKNRLNSFTDLAVGDLVVHDGHGIGRFVAMEKIVNDGVPRDYIKIGFAGTDFLYVPATALGAISKYIGGGEDSGARLSKLGGATWEKQKTKAKAAAKDLAGELIKLYAQRRSAQGFACLPDDDWQRSFEESFEYDETPDQLVATREIKEDMETPHPMDRLLCGDVGFGKTEVALRAVMKCIMSGKQAALLVPTTVLARQHFLTALSRFSGYPIKIETLSRFRTPKVQLEICRRVKEGAIDLVIGTHRLLQKDVRFKDLGLLVVDEEQRFGVSHKEKIKAMSLGIDVLTLSATPIPRTLNMALSGIRDMSVLEEAPRDRLPVQTFVLEHNEAILYDAISREIQRGGQVYYLHNRIEDMERVASAIRRKFPNVVVETAHGRMEEAQMSDVMNRLYSGDIQVLVCTTIIETGIDVSNVNTIVIENADTMGLAQLHQIRGRVGRSHRHAYAYLTYRRGKVLTELSQKRLSAIREFAEFGAGFKIAMRDLEIRGAGNVLGSQQSGHMMNVGYDMYLKLLEEAVDELSDKKTPPKVNTLVDININATLPEKYVADPGQRIDLYRRMGHISTMDDYQDMLDELIDRFGEPPVQAVSLLAVALLRVDAASAGIREINQKGGKLVITLVQAEVEKCVKIATQDTYKKRVLIGATSVPTITIGLKPGENPLEAACDFVKTYREI